MEKNQEHLKNLSEIRALMERSSSFISLSGLSGVSAGIVGLIAAVFLHFRLHDFMVYRNDMIITAAKREELILFTFMVMAGALVAALALAILFTSLKAKKRGLPVWDGSAKRLVGSLMLPLVIGGLFCLILIYQLYDWLVLPSMLVFYGLALINASKYTLHEIRWLGLSQVILGLTAMFFLQESVIFWGIGFGLMNIIYGMVMYFKYERPGTAV
jgi:hypothetical protein